MVLMKKLFILLFLLFSLAECLAKPSDENAERVTLQLNWKYQFEFAGFIAAVEKGYYKDAGLEVRLKEYEEGMDICDEVLEGRATFALHDDDLTLLVDQNNPVVWLQNYLKRSAQVLAVKPNIFTPKDLVGKRIMASASELDTTAIGLMLKKFGVDKAHYSRVEHTFNIDPFINNDVDAMVVYLSNELFALQEKNINYNLLDPTAYNLNALSMNLYTSKQEMQRSEERAKRFIAASKRGWEYALANKQELIDIIHAKYSTRKSKEALQYEADTIERLMMPDIYTIGSIPEIQVLRNKEYLKQSGLILHDVTPKEYIYNPKHSNGNTLLNREERDYLAKKKTIKMCIDPDWMPFEMFERGKHVGMTSDYFKIISKKIDTRIEPVLVETWTQAIEKAKNRECDIYSLAMETPERKTYMDFTAPYIRMPLVVATTSEQMFISNVEMLNGKTVGIVKGYAFAELLKRNYPEIRLVEYANVDEALQAVVNEEVFGAADSLATLSYHIQRHFPGELKITGKFDEKFELGIGTRNDEPLLNSIFQKAISSLTYKQHQDILNHWISVDVHEGIDSQVVWRAVIIALALGIFLFVIIVWQRIQHARLHRANEKTEEALASFKSLFNSTLEGIALLKDGKAIEVNDSLLEMIGYTREELVGRSAVEFIHPNYVPIVIKKMQENSVDPYEAVAIRRDGSKMHVLLKGQNIMFQGEELRISTVVDISKQKAQQRSLEIINDKLQELATHDQLTGLANRHMLEEMASKEVDRHRRYQRPLSMLIIDIDFFKQVNDSHGHIVGDSVLKELAGLIEKHSRSEDTVGRWGGEEFMIILPETDVEAAFQFADRLRVNISQHYFKGVGRLTICGGVAEYDDRLGAHEWFTQADDNLYFAKENGRNRIIRTPKAVD